jgi:cysteine desulfurase
MLPYFSKKYGNASSQHSFGREAKEAVEKAREIIARSINSSPEEIYFTSGGTESNNWALKEIFFRYSLEGKKNIIISKIEHPSIIEVAKMLEKLGARITYIEVDKEGFIDMSQLASTIKEDTLIVSVIHANNEIGTIQNIEAIGELCKSKKVYFHVDACQSYGKIKIDVDKQNIDLLTLNSHKIYGPKGVGALFIRKGINLPAFINGGGHEKGLRSGTENVPAIVGFGEAVKRISLVNTKKIGKLRDYTVNKILNIPKTRLNGAAGDKRLCNNINISFRDIEGESISQSLEEFGILISTGSACASHTLKKSHVLKAIGLNDLEINTSIRISLSKYTTKEEIDYFISKLNIIVKRLREISPFSN